jgi:hypothetical protein
MFPPFPLPAGFAGSTSGNVPTAGFGGVTIVGGGGGNTGNGLGVFIPAGFGVRLGDAFAVDWCFVRFGFFAGSSAALVTSNPSSKSSFPKSAIIEAA